MQKHLREGGVAKCASKRFVTNYLKKIINRFRVAETTTMFDVRGIFLYCEVAVPLLVSLRKQVSTVTDVT